MGNEKFASIKQTVITNKLELKALKIRVLLSLFRISVIHTKKIVKAVKILPQLKEKYRKTAGQELLTKAARVDGRYYWRFGSPGFPSTAMNIMHENEIKRAIEKKRNPGLRILFIAITSDCPMNCEHCFEGENINLKKNLDISDIMKIVNKYQEYRTTQIMFSGGEPMLRINDIYAILDKAEKSSDFWVITSGLGLNTKTCKKLKDKGLTGVMISLDHYEEVKHDTFRCYKGAYKAAINAAINANNCGLVTTLSLCPTKEFLKKGSMDRYMQLAKRLGATFVQIVEPRSAGRYHGKNVELSEKEINVLEEVYLKYNSNRSYKDYPIINYTGYHQRRIGCFGGGNRFFYIDSDGDAHLCPYCRGKICNTISNSAEEVIELLSKNSCHSFQDKKGIGF